MHTTIMPFSGPYAAVAALLAQPLPLPPNASPRVALEAQIAHLIDVLDAFDAVHEDLEETGDLEPWLAGSYMGGEPDLEMEADEEPSLGSLDCQMDQQHWSAGSADDSELDEADHEHSGGTSASDDEPIFGRMLPPSVLVAHV